MNDIFVGCGVEVVISPDNFLKIKETLTRIGIASKRDKKLFQSCHILHKQGRYSILHFKELFVLDGKKSDISEEDIKRRNQIVKMLTEWGLLEIIPSRLEVLNNCAMTNIKIVPYKEKNEWELVQKYTIGNKR